MKFYLRIEPKTLRIPEIEKKHILNIKQNERKHILLPYTCLLGLSWKVPRYSASLIKRFRKPVYPLNSALSVYR